MNYWTSYYRKLRIIIDQGDIIVDRKHNFLDLLSFQIFFYYKRLQSNTNSNKEKEKDGGGGEIGCSMESNIVM